MTATQKWAWFNLSIVGLTLMVTTSLIPVFGKGALGGLGLQGLLGFSAVFFRRPKATILMDERDTLIQLRAWTVAYSLFWIVLVVSAVFGSAMLYGQDGSIPVWIVQVGVAVAFMLVLSIASIALLVQYSGEVRHGG